jgi:antitoxin FitA
MATITVKNIPADLYENLKAAAVSNRRSINREIIMCIERTVLSQRISPETILARARLLREKTRRHPITDAALRKAKQAGRP